MIDLILYLFLYWCIFFFSSSFNLGPCRLYPKVMFMC